MAQPQQPQPRTYEEADRILQAPGSFWELEHITYQGRKQRVFKNVPRTMRQWAMENLEKWGDKEYISEPLPEPAPVTQRRTVTFAQVYDASLRWAGWMREQGVRTGDKVAIGGRNSSSWLSVYYATCILGAVPVLLNTTLTGNTQVHCLNITSPKLVLGDSLFAQVIPPIAEALASKKNIGPIYSWDNLDHLPASVRSAVKDVSTKQGPKPQTVADIKAGVGIDLTEESDASVLFTSGTTSLPKAVLSTQRQVTQGVITASYYAARYALRLGAPIEMAFALHIPPKRTCLLHAVPLFHVTGLGMMMRQLIIGGTTLFMRRWDTDTAMDLMIKEKVTTLIGVPALAAGILHNPRLTKETQLESVAYGGAPAPANLHETAQKSWPDALLANLYGATETNGLFTCLLGIDYANNPTSVGYPIPLLDMQVVDLDTRKPVPQGKPGLVMFRGSTIMKEYLNNPKATAQAIDKDGWYDTGDVGYLDTKGMLHLTDRAKDMIIRGGENIPSAEIENAVYLDERVLEAAAVAVPCPVMTERVGLAVSLVEGASATPEQILAAVTPRLRAQARPSVVVVWDGPLPRNANGKIIKDDVKKVVVAQWDANGRVEAKARL